MKFLKVRGSALSHKQYTGNNKAHALQSGIKINTGIRMAWCKTTSGQQKMILNNWIDDYNIKLNVKWILNVLKILIFGHGVAYFSALKGEWGSFGVFMHNVSQVEQREGWNTDCLIVS